jgi:hypothetical protein
MRAKSAAFARVLPHIQMTAKGKPTSYIQSNATPSEKAPGHTKGKVVHPSFL